MVRLLRPARPTRKGRRAVQVIHHIGRSHLAVSSRASPGREQSGQQHATRAGPDGDRSGATWDSEFSSARKRRVAGSEWYRNHRGLPGQGYPRGPGRGGRRVARWWSCAPQCTRGCFRGSGCLGDPAGIKRNARRVSDIARVFGQIESSGQKGGICAAAAASTSIRWASPGNVQLCGGSGIWDPAARARHEHGAGDRAQPPTSDPCFFGA